MNHFQGDSAPTVLSSTGGMVHLALWSPLLHETRCGIEFDAAKRTSAPVDCMTCLTRVEVFWIPIQTNAPIVNHFNERCWIKQMHSQSCEYGYTTECCFEEDPCDYHKPVEP